MLLRLTFNFQPSCLGLQSSRHYRHILPCLKKTFILKSDHVLRIGLECFVNLKCLLDLGGGKMGAGLGREPRRTLTLSGLRATPPADEVLY